MKSHKYLNNHLENIFQKYNRIEFLDSDPIRFPCRFHNNADIETASIIAALFAYGNVTAMKSFLDALFGRLGDSPYTTLIENGPPDAEGLRYRFQTPADTGAFLSALTSLLRHQAKRRSPVSGGIFESLAGGPGDAISNRIDSLVRRMIDAVPPGSRSAGIVHLIGKPESGSARKRYCMFLRWMTREGFPDFGIYRTFRPAELIVPLDTHILRMSHLFGWTDRKSADWKTAVEITEHLRGLDPNDPLRFDFVLTRPGILRDREVLEGLSGGKIA